VVGEQQQAELARPRPACRSPSAAATMQPFMRMCHWRAKPSASSHAGLRARPPMKPRISRRLAHALARAPGSRVVELEHHVDERAALEVVAREPLAEDVEDRQQALRGVARALDGRPAASARPALLARSRKARISSSLDAKLR
jgi:hypothetical protein